MKQEIVRKWLALLTGIVLIGFFIGVYLNYFNDCGNGSSCYYLTVYIGGALYYGMGALALTLLLLMAIPQSILWWGKFAAVAFPVAAWFFINTFATSTGWELVSETQVYQQVSGMFLALSTVVILANVVYRKFIRQRRGVQQ